MKPTVGRIVHYTNLGDADGRYPPEQQAALVTKVAPLDTRPRGSWDEADEHGYLVSLVIFYPTGCFWMKDVPFSPDYQRGHWTWPPR